MPHAADVLILLVSTPKPQRARPAHTHTCTHQVQQAGKHYRQWAGRHWAKGFCDGKQWADRQWAEGFSDDKRWAGRQWAEGFSGYG